MFLPLRFYHFLLLLLLLTVSNSSQDDTCVSPRLDCVSGSSHCRKAPTEPISKNVTKFGSECDLSDGKGCRFSKGYFPWCWTNKSKRDWGYCYSFCRSCTSEDLSCGFNNRWDCKQLGADFGRRNTTRRDLPCVNWKKTSYAHFGDNNICQASSDYTAWCYIEPPTSIGKYKWDFCFPTCGISEARSGIRVMTFNVWRSGNIVNYGPSKIAKHIKYVNPDIAALQEANIYPVKFEKVMTKLGHNWTSTTCKGCSVAVVHQHEHFPESVKTKWHKDYTTVQIPIKNNGTYELLDVQVWSLHLSASKYGPYKVCKKLSDSKIMEAEQGRLGQMKDLVDDPTFQRALDRSDEEPMIVAGDFNCPSPLDWTHEARHLHCKREFNWPAIKLLLDAGFKDAYREVHPDPVIDPGNTWTPLYAESVEPQDRIDMIFYKGRKLSPVLAEVYMGLEPIKTKDPRQDYKSNDYPSDHGAVFADFEILL